MSGRLDDWRAIEHEATREKFRDLAWYDGKLYAATLDGLFVLAGDRLLGDGWRGDRGRWRATNSAC